jgi:hypothetical protein
MISALPAMGNGSSLESAASGTQKSPPNSSTSYVLCGLRVAKTAINDTNKGGGRFITSFDVVIYPGNSRKIVW